jgi:hypothetical protein
VAARGVGRFAVYRFQSEHARELRGISATIMPGGVTRGPRKP